MSIIEEQALRIAKETDIHYKEALVCCREIFNNIVLVAIPENEDQEFVDEITALLEEY